MTFHEEVAKQVETSIETLKAPAACCGHPGRVSIPAATLQCRCLDLPNIVILLCGYRRLHSGRAMIIARDRLRTAR